MLKNNTDIFCSCSNYSSLHVRVKKKLFIAFVSDHEYINGWGKHKIFASLSTIVVE